MPKTESDNKIDLELARTFFRNISNHTDPEELEPERPPHRWGSPLIIVIPVILIALASIIVFANNLLAQKRLVFNISINVEPLPEPAPTKTVIPEEEKLRPQKHIVRERTTLYDFEENNEGWKIPGWTLGKKDHVAVKLIRNNVITSEGTGSAELLVDFPEKIWTAALIETSQYLDLEGYDLLSADIYIPPGSPKYLRGKFILTIGKHWRFMEMSLSIRLTPGKWTTVSADISTGSIDWRNLNLYENFQTDIRKMAIRIESDGIPYSGPIYIDNIRVTSKKLSA